MLLNDCYESKKALKRNPDHIIQQQADEIEKMKENEKLNEKQVLDYNERTDKALQKFTMFFQAVLEEV